ncbi:arsenate reductase family protein [Falsihalocynthiibacter sp. S25ZX9]|uniref:Arsenate reductase n=1 Tax=Falsihalocynthiibacter arcticus TaxID=1579316 RepID=A0A126V3J6_9RHOB|nr:ArsC/Spx/MgsR family protein [Falsihalocynthiibacter arcticus]AML52894.1 arsenate reductase [Falsihalocynthiibacter arcticus]
MIVYGINTCTDSQKAIKALEAAGKEVSFRDIRATPLSEAEWAELVGEFGDRLLDKKSTEWRGLSDWLKHSEAEDQLAAKPKLMISPVIRDGETYYLGWDQAVQDALL